MISARSVTLALLSVPFVAEAFRVRPKKRGAANSTELAEEVAFGESRIESIGSTGIIDELYTWGAAMPSKSALRDPKRSGGCWRGLRMVNVKVERWSGIWSVDTVPPLLLPFGYSHPHMEQAKMDEIGGVTRNACGSGGITVEKTWVDLHAISLYAARSPVVGGTAHKVSQVTAEISYFTDRRSIKDHVSRFGWSHVGMSQYNDKVSHLFQDNSNFDCIVTFEGTSRPMDWWDNIQIADAPMCGLPTRVHTGFRNQLRWTVNATQWQNDIRPKLPKCRKVMAAGHSLGGAMASLFAACINQAPTSGDGWTSDYRFLQWTKGTPGKLQPIA